LSCLRKPSLLRATIIELDEHNTTFLIHNVTQGPGTQWNADSLCRESTKNEVVLQAPSGSKYCRESGGRFTTFPEVSIVLCSRSGVDF